MSGNDDYAIEKSIQRAKRNASKRAYLRHFQADRAPLGGKPPNKDVVKEYAQRAQTTGQDAQRTSINTVVVLNKKTVVGIGRTPTITEPKAAAVEALHKIWRNERDTRKVVIAKTLNFICWHCFDGFDARAVHWIEYLNLDTRKLSISFTFSSKESAMEAVLKSKVLWKTTIPYLGGEV